MIEAESHELDPKSHIRHKLYRGGESTWMRYARLVTGSTSIWELLKYELITSFFGPIPGAIGLALRRVFYPRLFRKVGSGVVFGRNIVIRNANRITLGDRVLIDDEVLIDARGGGEEGVMIGDEVVVNRGVILMAKAGGIHVGAQTDIGSRTMIFSTGGIHIGSAVAVAGGCMIGGSMSRFESASSDEAEGPENRRVSRYTPGPVRIEDECTVFMSAIVLDGVRIGRGSVVGPGVVLRDSVPEGTTVAAHQKLVTLSLRGSSIGSRVEATAPAPMKSGAGSADSGTGVRQTLIGAVFSAVDEVNLLKSGAGAIEKSLATQLSGVASMDLVNLLVETEQQVEEALGRAVNLSDENLLLDDDGAPGSLGTFVERLEALLTVEVQA